MMDKEDHRRFMPPGYNDFENKFILTCAMCKHSFEVDIEDRPLPGQPTGIEFDFPPDPNSPLSLIQCPNCKINFIAPKKSWKFKCTLCGKSQPLIQNYKYFVNIKDDLLRKGVENGTLNVQKCIFCAKQNHHQFIIEKGMMIFEIIRSINPECSNCNDYLENARTWFWLEKYDFSYESFIKADIKKMNCEDNQDKIFYHYLLMASVLDRLEKREEVPFWFQKALDIKPNEPRALKALGFSYFNLKEWSEAIKPFEKIIYENIQVSDKAVDNLHLRYQAMDALVFINNKAGNIKETKHWEMEINKLIEEYPFLKK